jgi:penicillin-binding protein 2
MKIVSLLRWIIFITFVVLVARVFDLMLIRGPYLRKLVENNRIRKERIIASRGRILDRNNNELARDTIDYFDVNTNQKLDREIGLTLKSQGKPILEKYVRGYPQGETVGHLLGYLSQSTEEEVKSKNQCQIAIGDMVGRGGLEQQYDCSLRGMSGEKIVEYNAKGEMVREIGQRMAVSGADIKTTIDLQWQETAAKALSGKKGAVVVLDPQDGSIIALSSYPTFNPNIFTKDRDDNQIVKALNDPDLSLLNRSIAGMFPPGSTFKMIIATAGLQENKITPDWEVDDTGEIQIGQWTFGNWYWLDNGRKEGLVNLVKAIRRSNDTYFYKAGEQTGVENIVKWATIFGVGIKTNIDLPFEVAGFMPSPEWKEKVKGEKWFLGNTYHISIGQGDVMMTPLQVALETAVFANGGKLCQPHVAEQTTNNKQQTTVENGNYCKSLGIKKENLEVIKQGMVEACATGGTAFPFFNYDPPIACKTGTAEIGDGTKDNHAWFTMFYPIDRPQYVITVLLERGGSGAYNAAPVAKEIVDAMGSIN